VWCWAEADAHSDHANAAKPLHSPGLPMPAGLNSSCVLAK
jgi:hypothetical protein